MHVIGLIGGVASGKSWVAGELARRGAVVLDADQAGHAALRLAEVKQALRDRWGAEVFDNLGNVNRAAVAQRVFAPTDAGRADLAFLEKVTHPHIGAALREQLRQLAEQHVAVAVLDAPVLLKAGWNRFCSTVVYVDAPREVRLARAVARGWTPAEFDRRELAQESLETKRAAAHVVIENGQNSNRSQSAIDELWQRATEVLPVS